jgi:hypothetical protein
MLKIKESFLMNEYIILHILHSGKAHLSVHGQFWPT